MADEKDRWLGLRAAAELLGVHPSTLRSWADKRKVPVHRTPGGHRRFLRSDIEAWSATSKRAPSAEVQLLIQNALGRTRIELSEGRLEGQDWYRDLSEEHRHAYRQESRRLMQLLTKAATDEEIDTRAEAVTLGVDYARLASSAGMTLTEAVEVFLFFREFLMESVFNLSETTPFHFGSTWAAMRRMISDITNQVLLELVRSYDRAS